jgi:hypothetical protein
LDAFSISGTNDTDRMDAALKELNKLEKLASDAPSMGKSKTPAIQDSLNSLLQSLHVQKKRLEAGLASETELATLTQTVEARKKEIDDRQKEIYNSLARYGKALDKVSSMFRCRGCELTGLGELGGIEVHDAVADLRSAFFIQRCSGCIRTCHRYAFPKDRAILHRRDFHSGTFYRGFVMDNHVQVDALIIGI